MTDDLRTALRVLASALPAGAAVPVPREQLLELLAVQEPARTSPPAAADERLLTVQEAAQRLQVPVAYLYRHPRLPFLVRVGRKVRASPARLARYMERKP